MFKRPNFFIIGAPKCGTTSLASWLSLHPNIYMSPNKEPHFFDTDQKRRTDSIVEYEALFQNCEECHSSIGEASVFYLFSKEAVQNILEYNMNAKFIVMLRNPYELAVSLHNHYVFLGRENVRSFSAAWALDEERAKGRFLPFGTWDAKRMVYRNVCALGSQVERLLSHVEMKNVLFVFLEDVRSDAHKELNRVFDFLSLPAADGLDLPTQNAARANKFHSLANLSTIIYDLKMRFGIKKGLGILNLLRRVNTKTATPMEVHYHVRTEFISCLRQDILLLERLTGRNLSQWLDVG